jgi:hypothetical protein
MNARRISTGAKRTARATLFTSLRPHSTRRFSGNYGGRAVAREDEEGLRSLRSKRLLEAPAKSLAGAADPLSLHAAFHERTVEPYRNTNLPAAALERVARGVGDELVEDHSEPPATLCR